MLEIPVFLNTQCTKMLENRALHAIECTKILGITAFLNTLSNNNFWCKHKNTGNSSIFKHAVHENAGK